MINVDRKKRYIVLAAAAVLLFTAFIFGWDTPALDQEKDIYQISYIYRNDSMEESQQAIRQGIEQAAKDFKCEVTAVAFDSSIDASEQLELINREVKNGADAILIEPVNEKEIADVLMKINKKIPVVQMNSWVEGKENELPKVHVDNYKMGERLAAKIAKDMKETQKVLLVESEMNYNDIAETCRGVKEFLENKGIVIEEAEIPNGETERAGVLPRILENPDAGVVVVFSTTQLELCGKFKKENAALSDTAIYGIGKSNQVISYVEEKLIQAIGVTNEYSTGYLGAMKAVNELKGERQEEKSIDFSIVDIDNIYTTENQRLLFPFVQ